MDSNRAFSESPVLTGNSGPFGDAIEQSAVAMAVIGIDGRWLLVNRAVCDLLGYSADALSQLTFQQITHPDDLEADLHHLDDLLAGRITSYRMQKRYLRHDGSVIWGLLAVSLVRNAAGNPQYFISQIQDIDPLKQIEAQLHAQRDRLHVTLQSIADGVVSTDILGRIDYMNPVAEAMTGWTLDEARGQPHEAVIRLFDSVDDSPLASPLTACLADQRAHRRHNHGLLMGRDGSRRDIHDSAAPIRAETGAIIGAVLVFQDVSALRLLQRTLEFNAEHDALTGLPNRRRFETVLDRALNAARTNGSEHVLCFLDLDRFKLVNDSAGHAAGDLLLRTITQVLCRSVRDGDLVARLGGDEFAIILFDCRIDAAVELLAQLGDGIAAVRLPWEGRIHNVTVSMGLARLTPATESASVAMKQADVACYASKHAGRNRVSVYDADHNDAGGQHRQLILAAEIHGALAEDRLCLWLQRIDALTAGFYAHHEVLLRMRDREGNLVTPDQFIRPAEHYGLMGELDRWVLREVLDRQARRLAAVENLMLCINLSANSLNDERFLEFFIDLAERSPFPAARLTLEITETALITNLLSAGNMIDRIRALGCRIALDDFGIGLSSLSYLKTFKVDYLKIDGSFIRNLGSNAIDTTIVRAIHSIAHEIGVFTVAECVETAAVLEQVRGVGIDYAQGYAVANPAPLDEVLAGLQP